MASGVFKRVHEPRAKSIRHMIRVLGHTRRFNPVRGVQYYRHRLSHAAAERRRRIERQRMRRKRDRR